MAAVLPVGESEFAGQAWHEAGPLFPVVSENLPASQFVHTAAALAEYVPASHVRHVESDWAPVAPEYLPAVQSEHFQADVVLEYLPASQSKHAAAPFAEYLPAPHSWHVESAVAPVAPEYLPVAHSRHDEADAPEYFPEPQLSHALAPALALYFPATQAVHVPPFGPEVPGSHKH